MRRRTLLVGVLGLAGCTLDDPRIKGSPAPADTSTPAPLTGADHAAGLEAAAAGQLAAMAAAAWAGADAARYTLLASVHHTHYAVLSSAEPLRREAATVTVPTLTVPEDRNAAVAAVTTALTTLRDSHQALALQGFGLTAAFWASQAAAATQTLAALNRGVSSVTRAVPLRDVAVLDQAAATTALLDRCHEAVYGLESTLGRLTLTSSARTGLADIVTATKTLRDRLVARSRAASATPDPGAAVYSIPATTNDDQALALAASLLRAVTQAAAVAVASASGGHASAVADLTSAATLGLPLGVGYAEYPGWPDA